MFIIILYNIQIPWNFGKLLVSSNKLYYNSNGEYMIIQLCFHLRVFLYFGYVAVYFSNSETPIIVDCWFEIILKWVTHLHYWNDNNQTFSFTTFKIIFPILSALKLFVFVFLPFSVNIVLNVMSSENFNNIFHLLF